MCSIAWCYPIFRMSTHSIIPHMSYDKIGNLVKHRYFVQQCHVQSHQWTGKPATWQKRASAYKTFWRALSRGAIRFFTRLREHVVTPGVRKSREILRNVQKCSESDIWAPLDGFGRVRIPGHFGLVFSVYWTVFWMPGCVGKLRSPSFPWMLWNVVKK